MHALKTTSIILLIASQVSISNAQAPDFSAQCKEEMKKLSSFVGDWIGEATYQMGGGPPQTITQEEHVTWKLDGVALSIDGIGKRKAGGTTTEEVVFNAFAIVHYDTFSKSYRIKSFVREGHFKDSYFKILEENKFEWGFDVPTGKIRYMISIDLAKKNWKETGEYSGDGNTWAKFLEMNLTKKD